MVTRGRAVRRLRWAGLITVLVLCPLVIVAVVAGVGVCSPRQSGVPGGYAAQPARSAEWVANGNKSYSAADVKGLAAGNDIVLIPKFADNSNLQQQFEDVRQIVAQGHKQGRDVQVYLYFNASFWFDRNVDGWAPFSSSFQDSYLLNDANGDTVPYYGIGNTQSDGGDVLGHVVDLANPDYRAWALRTVTAWLQQSPAAGVVLDSANPFIGDQNIRGALSTGSVTPNELLCGATAKATPGNCDRVTAWNDGLSELLDSIRKSFAPAGHKVLYNGVAPTSLRPNRNVGLLDVSSGATNEAFCFASSLDGSRVTPTDPVSDLAIMSQAAADGKTLVEIVNYQIDANVKFGPYCLGTFLMGWQPGSSYLAFHRNYRKIMDEPAFPELDLDLGNPVGAFRDEGGLLVRSFQHGVVAVNPTSTAKPFTVPRAGRQVSDGRVVKQVPAGRTTTLAAKSAIFLLDGDVQAGSDSAGSQLCRTVS